jgi:photosystem II stability/assembly factor-like uncharacterized protein
LRFTFMKKFCFILGLCSILLLTGAGCIQIQTGASGTAAGVFKSVDRGTNWEQKVLIPTTTGRPQSIGGIDVLTLVFDPQDNRALYLGSKGSGLFYTYDGGESWAPSPTLSRGQVPAAAVDPQEKCTIYAGFENKVLKSSDCTRTWQIVYFETKLDKLITALAINPGNHLIVYAGTNSGDILKSNDGGVSWLAVLRTGNYIRDILVAKYNPEIVYVATEGAGIWKTTDAGKKWAELGEGIRSYSGSLEYGRLVFDESAQDSLFLASRYGILKTSDGGKTWTPINLLTAPGTTKIYGLAVNPKNGNEIYYATATTLYKTLNGGMNWMTRKLPSGRIGRVLLIDPKDPDVIYMGMWMPQ